MWALGKAFLLCPSVWSTIIYVFLSMNVSIHVYLFTYCQTMSVTRLPQSFAIRNGSSEWCGELPPRTTVFMHCFWIGNLQDLDSVTANEQMGCNLEVTCYAGNPKPKFCTTFTMSVVIKTRQLICSDKELVKNTLLNNKVVIVNAWNFLWGTWTVSAGMDGLSSLHSF